MRAFPLVLLFLPSIASAIEAGTIDPGDPAVVALVMVNPCTDDPPGVFCTGTVIGPRAVLTAAHCVNQRPPFLIQIFEGADLAGNGRFIAVSAIELHPDFSEAGGDLVADLAVVALAEDAAAAPVALAAAIDDFLVGTTARIVGYGLGEGATGARREGTVEVDSVTPTELRVIPAPSMSCTADSGGPVLIADSLAAVASSGDPGCAAFADNMRVDIHAAAFLSPAIDRAALAPAPPDPASFCITCDDTSDCLAGMVCAPANAGVMTCQPGGPDQQPGNGGCSVGGTGSSSLFMLLSIAALLRLAGLVGQGWWGHLPTIQLIEITSLLDQIVQTVQATFRPRVSGQMRSEPS